MKSYGSRCVDMYDITHSTEEDFVRQYQGLGHEDERENPIDDQEQRAP